MIDFDDSQDRELSAEEIQAHQEALNDLQRDIERCTDPKMMRELRREHQHLDSELKAGRLLPLANDI